MRDDAGLPSVSPRTLFPSAVEYPSDENAPGASTSAESLCR